jgi:hypothetical protein
VCVCVCVVVALGEIVFGIGYYLPNTYIVSVFLNHVICKSVMTCDYTCFLSVDLRNIIRKSMSRETWM